MCVCRIVIVDLSSFLTPLLPCSADFKGFKNKDVALLHKPTKSLIVADLLMNLPANEQVANLPPEQISSINE
jgi:hypothetical protein